MDALSSSKVKAKAGVDIVVAPSPLVVIVSDLCFLILISTLISGLSVGSIGIEGLLELAIPKVKGGCTLYARIEFAASLIKLISSICITSI